MKKLRKWFGDWFVFKFGRKVLIKELFQGVITAKIARVLLEKTIQRPDLTNEEFLELKGLHNTSVLIEERIMQTIKLVGSTKKPLDWRKVFKDLSHDIEALKSAHLPPHPQMN